MRCPCGRFAFWGAEESGLLGSEHYVANLPERRLDQIALNLNFDMLGSPNYVRFVYGGDGSDSPADVVIPAGSGKIERVFNRYSEEEAEIYGGTHFKEVDPKTFGETLIHRSAWKGCSTNFAFGCSRRVRKKVP